jgi:hypothetical protein
VQFAQAAWRFWSWTPAIQMRALRIDRDAFMAGPHSEVTNNQVQLIANFSLKMLQRTPTLHNLQLSI